MSVLSLGTRVSNLKSVALTVLERLTFIAQKFSGSRDRGHAPFWENFWVSYLDCPWEHGVKFEVHSFNRFEAIISYRPKIQGVR